VATENESDSDFGDFSLPKLTAKAKQVCLSNICNVIENSFSKYLRDKIDLVGNSLNQNNSIF
jgi:hypothetical protein